MKTTQSFLVEVTSEIDRSEMYEIINRCVWERLRQLDPTGRAHVRVTSPAECK